MSMFKPCYAGWAVKLGGYISVYQVLWQTPSLTSLGGLILFKVWNVTVELPFSQGAYCSCFRCQRAQMHSIPLPLKLLDWFCSRCFAMNVCILHVARWSVRVWLFQHPTFFSFNLPFYNQVKVSFSREICPRGQQKNIVTTVERKFTLGR